MRRCRIVERQYLYELLTGQYRPINHFSQIEEIADTETIFRTKRKHRDCRTRPFISKRMIMEDQSHFNQHTIYAPDFIDI